MFSGGMYFNTCPKSEQRGGVWRKGDLIDDVPDLRGALVTRDYNSNATEKVWIVLKCLSLIKTMRKKEERQEEDPYRNSSTTSEDREEKQKSEGGGETCEREGDNHKRHDACNIPLGDRFPRKDPIGIGDWVTVEQDC
jgi:hypothetical protein